MGRFMLRLPAELHQELVAWSKAEQRSLNGLIVYLLTQAVREWRAASSSTVSSTGPGPSSTSG